MNLSNHAALRCQQRGISNRQVDLLIKYGILKERCGAYQCFIPRRQVNEIIAQMKHEIQDLEKIAKSNKTLLLDGETIITAYNQY